MPQKIYRAGLARSVDTCLSMSTLCRAVETYENDYQKKDFVGVSLPYGDCDHRNVWGILCLLIKDIRESSHAQIKIAFEMMYDDFVSRANRLVPGLDSFIRESLAGDMYLSQNLKEKIKQTPNDQDPSYWSYTHELFTHYKRISEAIGKFAPVLEAIEFVVYDKERNVTAIYRHTFDQDILGGYLPYLHGGTFISLRTEGEVSQLWQYTGIQDIPKLSLPANVSALYDGTIPDTMTATISTFGKIATLKLAAPIFRKEELQGGCLIQIQISQNDVDRYSRFSQTKVNVFADTILSVGTLPEHNSIAYDESETSHPIELPLSKNIPPLTFESFNKKGSGILSG